MFSRSQPRRSEKYSRVACSFPPTKTLIKSLPLTTIMLDPGETGTDDTESLIHKYALQNAVFYRGKANAKAVMGKIMAENPDLRKNARAVMPLISKIVDEVNAMGPEAQRIALAEMDESLLERQKKEVVRDLPDLNNVPGTGVVMRFAPGPSGPLHIGHSRAVILNDEYVKRYGGKFILRLEDTNPEKIDPDAYVSIRKDLDWLGVKYHEVFIQSERFEIYYEHMEKLLQGGGAYVCTCDVEKWRDLKKRAKACPHRDMPPGTQLAEWEKMLDGTYGDGEASAVVKTDLGHPNPAVRDFVGMRINASTPHPRTGTGFRVYPLYNFSVAVDDHLMGITHVLRGKDHLNNTHRQRYVYDFFRWRTPEFIHYGWVSIEGTLLKTSLIEEGIRSGKYDGWADPRLGTFRAMARRGIRPDAIRRYWKESGIKAVDIRFSWDTLYSFNKDIIDTDANRYFFVPSPARLAIEGPERLVSSAPYHPDFPERGARRYELAADADGLIHVLVPSEEMEDLSVEETGMTKPRRARRTQRGDGPERTNILRLKDLGNVRITGEGVGTLERSSDGRLAEGRKGAAERGWRAEYIGNDLSVIKQGARIIQWCPVDPIPCGPEARSAEGRKNTKSSTRREERSFDGRLGRFPIRVLMPDGSIVEGCAEPLLADEKGEMVQFERFGFVRLERNSMDGGVAIFSHK